MFSTLLGYWLQMRGVHNLLLQFFTVVTSKITLCDTYFFHIVTTQNDHSTYVKHVLGSSYVFFTCLAGRGSPRDWYTTCLFFHPIHLQS